METESDDADRDVDKRHLNSPNASSLPGTSIMVGPHRLTPLAVTIWLQHENCLQGITTTSIVCIPLKRGGEGGESHCSRVLERAFARYSRESGRSYRVILLKERNWATAESEDRCRMHSWKYIEALPTNGLQRILPPEDKLITLQMKLHPQSA